ncbi:MAG: PucR family transcriptional regulator, partial [Solirubrobacteraceae bacterium]
TQRLLLPEAGSLLAGLRYSEIVALYPVESRAGAPAVREQCERLAVALVAAGFKLGVGGWHPGLAGVAASYAEAREAVGIALRAAPETRLVAFDDIIVEHILRSSSHSDRVLTDTIGPLRDYDTRRASDLLPTLRAFFESGYNLTRTGARLHVHANTVVYRLGRIKELTGRDPHDPDDLLVLSLALKLDDDAHRP